PAHHRGPAPGAALHARAPRARRRPGDRPLLSELRAHRRAGRRGTDRAGVPPPRERAAGGAGLGAARIRPGAADAARRIGGAGVRRARLRRRRAQVPDLAAVDLSVRDGAAAPHRGLQPLRAAGRLRRAAARARHRRDAVDGVEGLNALMKPDPPAATPPSPYDAPELYDLLFDTLDFDRAFWLHVGRTAKGPVLDLGCGTGRGLIPLLEAGVDADGVDLPPAMLARLEAKAAKKGLHPRLLAADMSDFTMPRRYARVISAFNAFAHCETTERQVATLRCCREHLEPGGALVLQISYPGAALWLGSGEPVLEHETTNPANGNRLQLYDRRTVDV